MTREEYIAFIFNRITSDLETQSLLEDINNAYQNAHYNPYSHKARKDLEELRLKMATRRQFCIFHRR